MNFTYWTADQVFNWNSIILVGWFALIFVPFQRLSKYLVLFSTLFLSILYSTTLLKTWFYRDSTSPLLNLFHLSGWQTLLKDPFLIAGTINHFRIIDLWIGQWMVYDFYSGYTFAYSITINSNGTYQVNKTLTFGRLAFTLLLILTYMAAPCGFSLYMIAKFSFLKQYKLRTRVNFKSRQDLLETSYINQLLPPPLNPRSIRFGDQLSEPLRTIYRFLVGIVGLFILFTVALPNYIGLIIYCRIMYRAPSSSLDQPTTTPHVTPNKMIPEYVRNVTAEMRLELIITPKNRRNWMWNWKCVLLQIATFIEYIPNSSNPIVLFGALQDHFDQKYNVPYFVFGDGIAVGSYELVKRYLQDIPPRKSFESLGWKVSSSQATFCNLTTIFLSSDDPDMELGRKIVFAWLHAFPHNLHDANSETRLHLSRLVPRLQDEKPDTTLVYQAVGEVMFFLATGGELRKSERIAFVDCVKNPLIFFPNWFNFLLGGHYLERKTLQGYYSLLQAFSRHTNGPALHAAIAAADGKKNESEILKLIAIVFSIAGSAAPAKLAVSVLDKLWSDRETNVRLFRNNPHNFIKECARLDKVVPMVNVFATSQIATEIENHFNKNNNNGKIHIDENTPIHCSIVNANRDRTIFDDPDKFIPERADLNKLIVWNGVEEDIMNSNPAERPKRYCPGHDLSLDVIQYVVEQFSPRISQHDQTDSEQTDQRCSKVLDSYTKLVMHLMQIAVKESNSSPSRGIDIVAPFIFPAKDLGIIRIDMAKFIPTWDEDEPNGSPLSRRFARWLVNQNIWDFHDCLAEFDSDEEAQAWRLKMFAALPSPNVVYTDMFSDQAMTRLAFAGCACHYTQRVSKIWHPDQGIPERQMLENAVYVNDMTALSSFRVRQPFERYGAAAYFDKDFQLIGIYWSHASRLVRPDDASWEHAKYVWRSSFFAYITIRDHLIVTHMIECNAFVSASRQYLPVNHPLRRLIKPFTYHTISINYQAAVSLVNERGLVHRIWAFDYDEFLKVCDYISMNYKFRLLPEFISDTMTPDMNEKSANEWDKIYPIYHDLNVFWKIVQTYVIEFFKINYNLSVENGDDHLPNDSSILEFIREICKQLGIPGITSLKRFIDVLSQLIAAGTGIHEHVGQISDYMTNPRFIGAKLQEGKTIQNIQTYTQILILSVVTGLRMPGILEDWSHLIGKDQHYEKNLENYRNFKEKLRNLSNEIDSRNRIRNYSFESFNPKYIECSTSV